MFGLLPAPHHERLRMLAAHRGMSMAAVVRDVLVAYLDANVPTLEQLQTIWEVSNHGEGKSE